MKRRLFVGFVIFNFSLCYSQSEIKKEKILKLIEVTGANKLGYQIFDNIINMIKDKNPLAEEFISEIKKEVKPEGLTELYIPIYDKYYTEEDVDNLIKFYQSPTGKKVTSVMPEMLNDSMEAGKKWGELLAQKIIEKLKKENK
ncbi:MAG: DUF2059 domain-containing protein [Limnohabitans sp.]|nr:DUF2059 domain-containing protein [Limnohabitans sp.]